MRFLDSFEALVINLHPRIRFPYPRQRAREREKDRVRTRAIIKETIYINSSFVK